MPYTVDGYTENIYPLKLHEYLASGKPIVSSPIASLANFADIIPLADDLDAWSRCLSLSLEPEANSKDAVAARQDTARAFDWNSLIYSLAQTVCTRLGTEYAARFLSQCDKADTTDLLRQARDATEFTRRFIPNFRN